MYCVSVINWNMLLANICCPLGMSNDLVGFGMNVDGRPGIRDTEGKHRVEYGQSECSVIHVLKVLGTF